MPGELVQFDDQGSGALSLYRTPKQAIEDARQCAVALKEIMVAKPHPVFFPDGAGGKEQYLEVEDWQLISAFHSCTAKVIECEYVDYGQSGQGWNAVAVLVDRNGMELSRAEALCLNTEENWGMVTEYEWRDRTDDQGKKIWNPRLKEGKGGYERERVEVGQKPKPLFQLKSMAQTRATSKVISTKFRYIAVLAGFASTPAEEMTGKERPPVEQHDQGPDIQRKSDKANPTNASTSAQTVGAKTPASTPSHGASSTTPSDLPPADAYETGPEPAVRPRSEKGAATPAAGGQQAQGAQNPPQGGGNGAQTGSAGGEIVISEKQGKMMFAIQRSAGLSDEKAKAIIANLGYTGHRDQLPRRLFQQVLDSFDPEYRFHQRDQGR